MDVFRLFDSGMTTRYHTENPVMRQCVAPHAWGVSVLLAVCHPNPSAALLKQGLLHDAAERRGPGDIRYQAKRDNPVLKEAAEQIEDEEFRRLGISLPPLTDEEQQWLKWADMAEVALYARSQYVDCGYPCALVIYGEAVPVIKNRVAGLGIKAVRLTNDLTNEYEVIMEKNK